MYIMGDVAQWRRRRRTFNYAKLTRADCALITLGDNFVSKFKKSVFAKKFDRRVSPIRVTVCTMSVKQVELNIYYHPSYGKGATE